MDRRAALLVAVVVGLAARLALVATSIGTNDVVFKIVWANVVREVGIAQAYVRVHELNHPPLSVLIMHWLDVASRRIGIEYTDLLRLVQVAADMITAAALVAIGRIRAAVADAPILFLLSPAAIAISGFHGNTDPTMVALLVVSILLLLREHGFAAGFVFAASVGIKIVPLFALPFLLLVRRRLAVRFAIAAAIGIGAIFVPVVVLAGPAVLHDVFGYSGIAGKWGFPALLLTVESWIAIPRTTILFRIALWYANNGRYIIAAAVVAMFVFAWRRFGHRVPILAIVPSIILVVLALAPGFGIQYLLWPLPLLPYALGRRMLLTLWAAISGYVVMTYTIWSGGFPWWFANSIAPMPGKPLVTSVGLIVWIALWVGAIESVRRLRAA